MKPLRWHLLLWPCVVLALAAPAWGQREPQIGYVYPAGGRRGDTVEVVVGGQYLDGASQVVMSGVGVRGTVLKHTKPLTPKQVNVLREKLAQARQQAQARRQNGTRPGRRLDFEGLAKIAVEMGVDAEQLKALAEFRRKRSDPKQQPNPQIAETVAVRIELAADAEPGARELRLITAAGLSNPLRWDVGPWPEYREREPNDRTAETVTRSAPLVINGQIMPGDVDRFGFSADRGERLVVATSARALMPYLADAVPGWFQATLALYDARGNEVAFADDYRFHPDPVLFYKIPQNGAYVLEIKDAIFRGREDFVYRVTLGETRFVTNIFPLGGRQGRAATVEVKGWNLPTRKLTLTEQSPPPGIRSICLGPDQWLASRVLFAVDTLPECLEQEPNDALPSGQRLTPPVTINGRIGRPGDWDVFGFAGRAGNQVVAEVHARRLNSPLDSLLKLTDAAGRQLMVNDDHEDAGAGLTTHQADSRLAVTLPADETYYLHLGDTQGHGGREYGYRLRISAPRPDFQLRVVPSGINLRAGMTVPITVHALRRDGFAGEIALALKQAPAGFVLGGGWVPAGQDRVRVTLTAPALPTQQPVCVGLDGRAVIDGREIFRTAVPAEDMVQAFVYHHLVPAEELLVCVTGRRRGRWAAALAGKGRVRARARFGSDDPMETQSMAAWDQVVKLPAGGTVRLPLAALVPAARGRVEYQLSEPPDGISIETEAAAEGDLALVLQADAAKVRPGQQGNLIVNAFVVGTPPRSAGGPKGKPRRLPLGSLPAIRFEIVAP